MSPPAALGIGPGRTAFLPPSGAAGRERPDPAEARSGARSVERALDLLSLVGRAGDGGLAMAQAVGLTGLARPTARRLLMALMGARLIEQDPVTRRYHPGPEAFLLGALASPRHGLMIHAGGSLARLAAATEDTALLSVPQGDHVLCLHREEGAFPIRTHALLAGDRNPMGIGAAGLALLAALPPAQADAMLDRIAPAIRARLQEQAGTLAGDLAAARRQGWALNPGRVVEGSWGIGVAVLWPDGRPAAALSVAAIESRMPPERRDWIAALMRDEARGIEERLAAHFTPRPRPSRATGTPLRGVSPPFKPQETP